MDADLRDKIGADPGAESLDWWDGRSALDPLAAVLDPSDEDGRKNAHIHAVQSAGLLRFARFKPTDHVLDFGCGNGRFARLLASRAGRVTGVDISTELVRSAKLLNENDACEFLAYDGKRLPFETETFDILVTVGVLQMFCAQPTRFREVVREIGRVLRPSAAVWMIERMVPAETTDEWTPSRWRSELADCGFLVGKIHPVRHGSPTKIADATNRGRIPRRLLGVAARIDLALTTRGGVKAPYTDCLVEARRA